MGPESLLEGPVGPPEGPEGLPEGPEGLPGAQGGLLRTDRHTDVWTDKRTEFLPILQEFIPCRGRSPKTSQTPNHGGFSPLLPLKPGFSPVSTILQP